MDKPNMPANRSCAGCKFFDTVINMMEARQVSICRFKSPVPVAVVAMTPQGPNWMVTTLWPQVTASDWCGDYQPLKVN